MPITTARDSTRTKNTEFDATAGLTTARRRDTVQSAGAAALGRMVDEESAPTLGPGGATLSAPVTVRASGGNGQALVADGTVLPAGTYVEIPTAIPAGSAQVWCRVYSGRAGELALIPVTSLVAEPGLGQRDGAAPGTPDAFTYGAFTGVLWEGQPKTEDVAQGHLNDCYFNAAMGAVVAADPQSIIALFQPSDPHAASYKVGLHRKQPDGSFVRHVETVDRMLPLDTSDGSTDGSADQAAYSSFRRVNTDARAIIWPALLEKAYAQMRGSYRIEEAGGTPAMAMESITGRPAQSRQVPLADKDVLPMLRGLEGHSAISASTISYEYVHGAKGFESDGSGSFQASFQTNGGGASPDILPSTFVLRVGGREVARDDRAGNLVGTDVTGTVEYDAGAARVTFGGAAPRAEEISADFSYEGLVDARLNVHADHAYIFVGITSAGLIELRNPWGVEHPQPMTPADFRRLFTSIYSSSLAS